MKRIFSKGFTLIEILIAVGIFAAATMVFISSVAKSVEINVEDEIILQVALLANNKMIEVETELQEDITRGKFPDEAAEAGKFEEPYNDFTWEYTIAKVEIPVMDTGDQSAVLASSLKNIMDKISESVREVKLDVVWTDPYDEKHQKKIDITTHIVNLK
jgi:prepilin-type N-terminal cleavage/methylation domain-containing protein